MHHQVEQFVERINEVRAGLVAVSTRLDEIADEIMQLQEKGVFDEIPSESWETRNGGETRYLRLVFPTTQGARRKMYVGADPGKIAEAQAKIERSRRNRELLAEEKRLCHRLERASYRLADANAACLGS